MKSNVFICPPCGESVAQATKEGQNKNKALWPLLPRLTAVLPPQGREMSFGFTLIELLVVVLIIGILAAVALPQYNRAIMKARMAILLPLARKVYTANQLYFAEHGSYADFSNEEFRAIFSDEFPEYRGALGGLASMVLYPATPLKPWSVQPFVHAQGSGAVFYDAGFSGKGGFIYRHNNPGELVCLEYACHMVQEGSFCRDLMGYTTYIVSDCVRLYRK